MFKTRLISGIVLVFVIGAAIYSGKIFLAGVLLAASLIGLYEFLKVFSMEKTAAGTACYIGAVVYYGILFQQGPRFHAEVLVVILTALVLAVMAAGVFSYPKYETAGLMAPVFALLYVAVMLSYVYRLRILPSGLFAAGLIFIGSWGCDTCAYCVGMLIGRHKLAPVLSPKKSVEGAVGGVAGSALLAVIYTVTVGKMFHLSGAALSYAGLAAVLAVISQAGDLFASAVKRQHNVKDYGKLIPGHGGILDRFDSVIVTAPVLYYLFLLIENRL